VFKAHYLPICLGLCSAALLWLAFPGGGGVWGLMPLALIPLFLGIRMARSAKGAALACFLAGILHYHLLMYWIMSVLGQYGGLGWFLSSQALFLLATYMSLYYALFGFLAHRLLTQPGWLGPLFLVPVLWVGLEWLKGWLFGGLPWMDLGYSLYEKPVLIQFADVFGHLGLSFLVVFANTFVVLLLRGGRSAAARGGLCLVTIVIFGTVAIYANSRWQEFTAKESGTGSSFSAGIAQGNIDQSLKWSQGMQQKTVATYLRLTDQLTKAGNPPQIVIWPETALPFYPENNPYMAAIGKDLVQKQVKVLTGAPMYEIVDRETKNIRFYNSALLLDGTGSLGERYNKSHLVPFGEYVPFREYLPFIAPLVETVGDFSPGTIGAPLRSGDVKMGVLICFESVFPKLSRKWVEQGANVLVNLTNDAWYGKSSAPHHSLAMAVLRAVETRRSLIRSANTGISAFISPTGEVKASSDLFAEWAGSAEVALLTDKTVWVRWGHWFGPVCAFFLGLVFVYQVWPGNNRRKKSY